MFFFPYRVDLPLGRIPFLTILVSLLCIVVYINQVSSANKIEENLHSFCVQQKSDRNFRISFEKIKNHELTSCAELMYYIHSSPNPTETIKQLGRVARPVQGFSINRSQDFIVSTLQQKYAVLSETLPGNLTDKLAYDPDSYNFVTMITSQFAHADLGHLIGNLLFFFAFAASLEIVLGSLIFLALFTTISIGVSLAFSLSTLGMEHAISTIGLSGVVMGMIGLFSYLMPAAYIRCLLIILLYFRIIKIPAWLLAIWYFGWDFYELFISRVESNVNLVAHVSGAFLGYILAALFLRNKKQLIKQHLKKIKH